MLPNVSSSAYSDSFTFHYFKSAAPHSNCTYICRNVETTFLRRLSVTAVNSLTVFPLTHLAESIVFFLSYKMLSLGRNNILQIENALKVNVFFCGANIQI